MIRKMQLKYHNVMKKKYQKSIKPIYLKNHVVGIKRKLVVGIKKKKSKNKTNTKVASIHFLALLARV